MPDEKVCAHCGRGEADGVTLITLQTPGKEPTPSCCSECFDKALDRLKNGSDWPTVGGGLSRYVEPMPWVVDLVAQVKRDYFPDLANAKVKVLFDLKRRKSLGRNIYGRMHKASDLIRTLTGREEPVDGFDFVMTLDRALFMRVDTDDRIWMIRHELSHCEDKADPEKDEDHKWGIRGHDLEVFRWEVREMESLWDLHERLGHLAILCYEAEGEPPPEKDPNQQNLFKDRDNA